MLTFDSIVEFWCKQELFGDVWCHPYDRKVLTESPGIFDLRFPVSPYVGDVTNAPVIILNANAGFHPVKTPAEFASPTSIDICISQVRNPSSSKWSFISPYYLERNYADLLENRQAVVVNASPYRSTGVKEAELTIKKLPSTTFHRRWIKEAVIPLTESGKRLVLAHRWGFWEIPRSKWEGHGIHIDHNHQRFKNVSTALLHKAEDFLKNRADL